MPLLIGLTVLAALSPLLTFARLFQMKEWRRDRLLEHLRQHGVWGQLFGTLRPLLIAGFFLALSVFSAWGELILGTLGLLSLFTVGQMVLRRQRMPVWTQKAILIFCAALILMGLAAWTLVAFAAAIFLPLLPILAPFFILVAWLLFLPLDTVLKNRVMGRATQLRKQHPMTVIGIAGSVGKTTTKELLKHLLTDLSPITTPAHVNTEMGVAQWLINQLEIKNQKSEILIVEMGAYRTGEIKLLCQIAQPTIGVLTRLGSDHLALFGSEEAIRDANAELLEALPADGHAHILVSEENDLALTKHARCTSTTVGTLTNANLRATKIQEDTHGINFDVEGHTLHLPLHGTHNAQNALLAISVAHQLGISWERIAELLKTSRQVAHTFSVREERGVLLLDDTYNISPLSFRAALQWAAQRTERPRVLLTAGLLETGSEEDRFYRELGALATHGIERAIFLSPAGIEPFGEAWGKQVELLSKEAPRLEPGSALLAIGRMPLSAIQQVLPSLDSSVSLVSSDSHR